MMHDLTDDTSRVVPVMAWCCQATSHYLGQCWPRSMSLYDVTRPQWVNIADEIKLPQFCTKPSILCWFIYPVIMNSLHQSKQGFLSLSKRRITIQFDKQEPWRNLGDCIDNISHRPGDFLITSEQLPFAAITIWSRSYEYISIEK